METVNKFLLEPSIGMEKESGFVQKSNPGKQKPNRRIVSKVTKLTLKPKSKLINTKNPSKTTQITTKKYACIKPVTIKSRSTLISHESTYCIKNIPRKTSTKNHRQNAENASQQQRSHSIVKQSTKSNPKQQQQQPHSDIKSDCIWNMPIKTQILQEITSAVVNQSLTTVKDPIIQDMSDSADARVSNGHRNSKENSTKFKLKETIALPMAKGEKGPVSREEINRRLSALQKNSLKIVENNVQKAKRFCIVTTSKMEVKPKTEKPGSPSKKSKSTPIKPQSKRKSSQIPVTPSKLVPKIKTNKNRIGILRRPAAVSPTFDSMGKNQSALVQTPSSSKKPNQFPRTTSPQAVIDIAINSPESLELTNISLKVPEIVNPNEKLNCSLSQSKQLHLDENKEYHNVAGTNAIDDKNDSIPYWLRPTPVQPYPYNFILAVRKKLESITNPVLRAKGTKTTTTQKSLPPIAETFSDLLSKVPSWPNKQQKQHQKTIESITNNNNNNSSAVFIQRSVVEPVSSAPINSINVSNQIKSPLKVQLYSMNNNSNVSNNNVSRHIELKSNQMEMINDNGSQDTLSISSGILTSYSSPEKNVLKLNVDKMQEQQRPITPLATDAIDCMTIVKRNANQSNASERESTQNQFHISSHINFERGNSFDERSQLTFNDLNSADTTTASNDSRTGTQGQTNDVHKLLKDFNESLSQVIKVNEYLHGILSNIPTSRKDETPTTTKESTKYSNDFEEATTTERNSIEEDIEIDKQSYKRDSERVEQVGNIGYSNSNNETNSNIRPLFDETTNKSSIRTEVDNSTGNGSDVADVENVSKSDSPTNNDLKSISLSIAKKSIATEDETNATESYRKHIVGEPEMSNQSIGSDIFIMFNKTSMGLKDELNSSTWSMQSLSYSSLGVCEQLLKSEVRKSQDLASLLKIRERALIDRFKGQIAWLELHKQKFKKAGRIAEISMIKKKQRALLLRLNHDRKELHRIIKERRSDSHNNTPINDINVNYNISHMSTNMSIRRKPLNQQQLNNTSSKQALKALELSGGGTALEFILQRRENELRRRREHVEKLLNWHQRLDIEEQQVMKLEQMLMFVSSTDAYQPSSSMNEHEQDNDDPQMTIVSKYDKQKFKPNNTSQFSVKQLNDLSLDKLQIEHIKQKQINKIEKSLNTLKSISAQSVSDSDTGLIDDVVEILGRQLNKLWRRLTGQCEEEFTPDRVYRLTKSDLESLYERAKSVVLSQFDSNDEFKKRLIDGSMSITEADDGDDKDQTKSNGFDVENNETKTVVPELNLTSSPEQQSINPKPNTEMDQGYYFSNNECVEAGSGSIETDLDVDHNKDNVLNATHDSEDLQSDITEDSLNQGAGNESASKSIELQENIRTEIIENDTRENSNPMEKSPSIPTFSLNVSQNDFQLIEDTSFPNIDMHLTLPANISSSSLVIPEDILSEMNTIQSPDNDMLYESEKFEEVPPTESVETSDSSKIDEQMTVESNNTNGKLSENNDESIQTEQSIDVQKTIEKTTIEEKTVQTSEKNDEATPSANAQSDNSSDSTLENDDESDLSPTKQQKYKYSLSSGSIDHNKVLEADALKQQLPIGTDAESKTFPLLREIPNKPPPPYPAHRQLPKMPPFPTNDRIKGIVCERIEQLYRESKIEPQLQTPMTPSTNSTNNINISINSNAISSPLSPITPHPTDATFVCSPLNLSPSLTPTISNVYERIIHDCCGEIMEDIKNDANAFRQPLAFYNPPNRLLCYQMYALEQIFKLLNRSHGGRHDNCKKNSTLLPPRVARLSSSNRRKRDTVDEILIQELYEDDSKWTNFAYELNFIAKSVENNSTKLFLDESSEVQNQSL